MSACWVHTFAIYVRVNQLCLPSCSICVRPDWIWQDIHHGKCFYSWRQYTGCHSKGHGQHFPAHHLQQGCRVYCESGICGDPQGNTLCSMLGFDKHTHSCHISVHMQHDQPLQHAKLTGMQPPVRPNAMHLIVCCI